MEKEIKNSSTIILSYKKLVLIFSSVVSFFSLFIGYIFYHFKKNYESLELSIQKSNASFDKAIMELRSENIALKRELLEGKEQVLLDILPVTSSYAIDPSKVTGIILICLSSVALFIAAYHFSIFFFEKTFIGLLISWVNMFAYSSLDKWMGGPGAAQTAIVSIDESFELQILMREDDMCAVMFRTSSDSTFLPLQTLLEQYRDLLAPTIDVLKIQEAFSKGNSLDILEAISKDPETSSEIASKGIDTLKAFF